MAMSIIETRCTGKAACIAVLLPVLLMACASAPHQAMSDARQAIESAEPVVMRGADPSATLDRARELLGDAKRHLHAGEYREARVIAERAKRLAIEARERAEGTADEAR